MQTRSMRPKNVSSTAPMISRSSPVVYPSCSHAAVVSSSAVSNICITPAYGGGRTPYLPLQPEPSEKLVQRVPPYAALEAKRIQRGDYQARQPLPAICGFPEP
jgi:hypothetical protein